MARRTCLALCEQRSPTGRRIPDRTPIARKNSAEAGCACECRSPAAKRRAHASARGARQPLPVAQGRELHAGPIEVALRKRYRLAEQVAPPAHSPATRHSTAAMKAALKGGAQCLTI
jgi:hypothetical protein